MAKGNSAKSKGQKRDDLERKRDERARRRVIKKEHEIKEYLQNDENFVSFKNQLEAIGLKIKDILGDGNCLFRALGDQLNGDHTAHAYHRRNTIQYMKEHRQDFEPFMEDGVSFEKHLRELSKLGTYGGNDSIVAFARNNGLDIVIHQLNNPRWVIHGSEYSKTPEIIELHLAYHNGEHYSSVRSLSDPGDGPAWQYNKKNMTQPMQNKETTTKSNKKTKLKKEQKKKDKPSQQQGATASPSVDNGEGLEQIVMNATGCKDLKLIAETLEENFFDVDVSIGYILQLMSIMEDQDNTPASDTLSNSPATVETTEAEEHLSDISENNKTETLKDNENTTDKTDSIAKHEPIKDGDGKNALNEFVDNLRDTLTVTDSEKSRNNMIKQGARPKENTKKNSPKVTTHLSNRQRKELAKQEKKKRREERRKEDEQIENSSSSSYKDENSSNSLVADLGAVCI